MARQKDVYDSIVVACIYIFLYFFIYVFFIYIISRVGIGETYIQILIERKIDTVLSVYIV